MSSSTDIRIVIADDHPVVLQGLAALIDYTNLKKECDRW